VVGVALIGAGIVAGGALWWGAGQRYDEAVAELAPAFVGCDTTLVFERTGTYTFFVETKGDVGQVDGDCESDDRSYDTTTDDTPDVDMTLVDGRGDKVDLDRASGPSYERDGRRGVAVRTAQIESTGDYVLTATADEPDVVVRVGRDPAAGVTAMRVVAVVTLLAGVVAGVVLLVVGGSGASRRSAAPQPATGPAWPHGPQPPPLGPPPAVPPNAPPYVPRPPSYAPPPVRPQPTASGAEPERPAGGWPGGGRPLPPPEPPA